MPVAGHGGTERHRAARHSSSCVLLAIVVTSYRQTIKAYPQGGGSYVVSRENLGPSRPRSSRARSILVDYVLTVAVSVSAGVAAIDSAFPELRNSRVVLCLGFIVLMTRRRTSAA